MSSEYIYLPPKPVDKKAHLQKWSRKYFAEKLTAEGFISYKDEHLSWYRVVNGELMQSVFLWTDWKYIPIMPNITFGLHPLFIEAPLPQKHYETGLAEDETMNRIPLPGRVRLVDDDVYVSCPNTPLGGAEKLDDVIFPLFSEIRAIEDAYHFYMNGRPTIRRLYTNPGNDRAIYISPGLIDMAIYLNDHSFYPQCISRLEEILRCMEDSPRIFRKRFAYSHQQWDAIMNGQRDIYLDTLEDRKKKFVKKLNKTLGIKI